MINVLRLVIAAMLLYSGLVHASQPYLFIHSAAAYRLGPPSVIGVLALVLPYLHLVLAVQIFLGINLRTSFMLAAIVFGIYAAAQCLVLIRGIEITCGCFGYSQTAITSLSALLPLTACGVSVFLALTLALSPSSRHSQSVGGN